MSQALRGYWGGIALWSEMQPLNAFKMSKYYTLNFKYLICHRPVYQSLFRSMCAAPRSRPLFPVHTQRSKLCSVCSASYDSGCILDPNMPPRRLQAEQRPHWPEVHTTPEKNTKHVKENERRSRSVSTRSHRLLTWGFMFRIKLTWSANTLDHISWCNSVHADYY